MKHLRRLSVILLLLSFFLPLNTVFSETEIENVHVILHKRLFKEDVLSDIQNTGEEMDFEGEALNDVEFTVYDVTENYALLRDQGESQEEAQRIIAKTLPNSQSQLVTKGWTTGTGQLELELPAKNQGKDSVYLFVETQWPKDLSLIKQATPLVLVLPAYKMNTDGSFSHQLLNDIHLYPKNIGENIPEVPLKPVEPKPEPERPKPSKPLRPILPQTGEAKSMLSILGAIIVSVVVMFWWKKGSLKRDTK